MYSFNIDSATSIKSSLLYLLKLIIESNRLIKALSNDLYKFVVAINTMLSCSLSNSFNKVDVALPISLRSLLFNLSIARASISSNNITTLSGCGNLLISSNAADIFFDVCPSLLSIIESNFAIYKSLLKILAICLTVSVLPVPGKPSNKNLLIPTLWPIALTIPTTSFFILSGSGNGELIISTFSKKDEE